MTNHNTDPSPQAQKFILLMIWGAMQIAPLFYYFFLYNPPAEEIPAADNSLGWIMIAGCLSASIVVRWLILPRAKTLQDQLVRMIIGLALAESTMFYAIFFMEGAGEIGLAVSMLGIAQFCPLSYGSPDKSDTHPFHQK